MLATPAPTTDTPADSPVSVPVPLGDRLTEAQFRFLTARIATARVQHNQGQSHLEQWDVRRHLIRIFGFGGFDVETIKCDMIERLEHAPGTVMVSKWVDGRKTEAPNEFTRWTIVYRAEVRLTVKSPVDGSVLAVYEDGATGDSCNQPSIGDAHDQAMKTALSQALKRCAVNLGDQFGLSLYNGGNQAAVVQRSLVYPTPTEDGTEAPDVASLPADVAPSTEPEGRIIGRDPEAAAKEARVTRDETVAEAMAG
jgi:hypothetical protein